MSSFRKPGSQQSKIPGTNTSLHNGQLLTSTGNPSLDHILGGGLVLGAVLLIEEDQFVSYSKVLSKYFLAEGVVQNHTLLVASLDDDPKEFVKKIPSPIEDHKTANKPDVVDEDMRIAFRYNNLPKVNSVQAVSNVGHHFDLTTPVAQTIIDQCDISYWGESTLNVRLQDLFHNPRYLSLLDAVRLKAQQTQFSLVADGLDKSILRVCINSFGSPLWYDDHCADDICKFFAFLKALARQSQMVCCVTVPMHLLAHLDQPHLVARIRHMVDYSVQLEAFAGSDKETNPYFKEYHGLLHIRKLAALNTFAAFTPETYDLAFKLRRRKFVIEKLHLPPELQEAEHRDQTDIVPKISCGGSGSSKNKLDF